MYFTGLSKALHDALARKWELSFHIIYLSWIDPSSPMAAAVSLRCHCGAITVSSPGGLWGVLSLFCSKICLKP